jgi:hypothetical protein
VTDVFDSMRALVGDGDSIEALLNRLGGVIEEIVCKEFDEYFTARDKGAPIDVEFLANRLDGVIKGIVQKELEERIPAGMLNRRDGVIEEIVRKELEWFRAEVERGVERERQALQADFDVVKAQFLADHRKRAVANWLTEFGGKPN